MDSKETSRRVQPHVHVQRVSLDSYNGCEFGMITPLRSRWVRVSTTTTNHIVRTLQWLGSDLVSDSPSVRLSRLPYVRHTRGKALSCFHLKKKIRESEIAPVIGMVADVRIADHAARTMLALGIAEWTHDRTNVKPFFQKANCIDS